MFKDITILLTGAGAPGAPSIIRCLRKVTERKIRIVGVDMNSFPSGRALVDAFYPVPPASSDNFINAILSICTKEKVDIVIPLVTRELMKFSESKQRFLSQGTLISVLDQEILRIANNKAELLKVLKNNGIQTPDFRIINDIEEFETACKVIGYPEKPVCIKQTQGNGSRGVRFIDASKSRFEMFLNEKPNSMYISYEEMISILREKESIPELIVMEYLPGEEYSVDLLVDCGEVKQIVGRYNSKVVSSIPIESTLEHREDIIATSIEIALKLKLSGNIGLDFRYDAMGLPQIMEINPRLTATIVAPASVGINFPYLGIKQLLGEKYETLNVNYSGTRMVRRWLEVFYDKDGNEIQF